MEFLNTTFSNVAAFIVVLGVIIFVHEAGHLLMAKAFGVRVLTFSLGFGTRLWGFTRGGTDYRVSLVPLGGYVKLSGELPGEGTGDPGDFLSKPRWQRFLVYLAGPAMNAVLSVGIIAFLFWIGIAVPALQNDIPARVGFVLEGSSADTAGLQQGDVIVSVDGEAVETWEKVMILLITNKDEDVDLLVDRGGQRFNATVSPELVPDTHLKDTAGILPEDLLTVTELRSGMPAKEAGLKVGDQLRTLEGRPVVTFQGFVETVSSNPGKPLELEVRRDGQPMTFTVVPEDQEGTGKIGLGAGIFQKYGLGRAFVESAKHNVQIIRQTLYILGKIFTRRIAAESALSGPIEIAKFSGDAARLGFKPLMYLMGVISISIGFLNLLPIPVLDGGQMVMLAVEGVMRRDLSMKIKEVVNQVGFVMIMLIMLAVVFFDLKKSGLGNLIPGL